MIHETLVASEANARANQKPAKVVTVKQVFRAAWKFSLWLVALYCMASFIKLVTSNSEEFCDNGLGGEVSCVGP